MRRFHQWIIFYEFFTLKKKNCILYDQASHGGKFMGNQGSIPRKLENKQPLKLYFSIKIKILKLEVKSVMFSKISYSKIPRMSKYGKLFGSTTTIKIQL